MMMSDNQNLGPSPHLNMTHSFYMLFSKESLSCLSLLKA